VIWLLLLAGAGVWAWKTGRLGGGQPADLVAILMALIAFRMLGQGRVVLPLLALAGTVYWFWLARRNEAPAMPAEEARRLLEVPGDADSTAIRAAHRRLITRVHPDAGGSAELARKVNAARDTLLSELRRKG
jgi:DnaJ-domain-containing protein 1